MRNFFKNIINKVETKCYTGLFKNLKQDIINFASNYNAFRFSDSTEYMVLTIEPDELHSTFWNYDKQTKKYTVDEDLYQKRLNDVNKFAEQINKKYNLDGDGDSYFYCLCTALGDRISGRINIHFQLC